MLLRTRRKPYVTAFLQPSSRIVNRIRLLRKRPTLKKKKNKTAVLAFWEIAGKNLSVPQSPRREKESNLFVRNVNLLFAKI